MVGANSMEMVALTTAMADAHAKVQATLREMRKQRPNILSDRLADTDSEDVDTTIETSEIISNIIQTQLSYILRKDSLITIPGTNADNCHMKGGDYCEVGNSFEAMKGDIQTSAIGFDWAGAPYNINGNLNTLTRAFARSLAALGVEVWSWEISAIKLSQTHRSDLADEIQEQLETSQASVRKLRQAIQQAKQHILRRFGEIKEASN